MLGEHRDDHSRVFRALAFMNGRRVRGHQHVELSKSVSDGSALEDRNDLTRSGIDLVDGADIAVRSSPVAATPPWGRLRAAGEWSWPRSRSPRSSAWRRGRSVRIARPRVAETTVRLTRQNLTPGSQHSAVAACKGGWVAIDLRSTV